MKNLFFSLTIIFMSNFVLLNETNATIMQFAQVPLPKGITVDQNGYVYVQSLSMLGDGGLYKFDPNGTLLSRNSNLFGAIRLEADAVFNILWALEKNGQLYYIIPDTLQAYPYLNVRDLIMSQSQTPVLNMLTGEKIPLWAIDPIFGDIAVRHTNDGYDLFISGLTAAGGIPFIVRLRFDDSSVSTNIVVASFPLPNSIIPPPFDTQPPGIAVNEDGTVLTALMDNLSGGTTPYYLTSFNADFPETNVSLPQFLPEFYGHQVVSFGMTDSAMDKGFYFVTSANGLNCGVGSAVFYASQSLDKVTCVADLSDFGWGQIGPNDVAVGPDNNFVYVAMSSNNLVLRLETQKADLGQSPITIDKNLSFTIPNAYYNGKNYSLFFEYYSGLNWALKNVTTGDITKQQIPIEDDLSFNISNAEYDSFSIWLDFSFIGRNSEGIFLWSLNGYGFN